jgi:hypothetical protein
MTCRAPGKPMSVPHNRLVPKASSRAASVSAHGTDASPEVFEDLLEPTLFDAEAPTSQSTSSGPSQDIDTHPSDSEDEDDLPSLDSLLYRNPTHVKNPHDTPAHEKPTRSTRQIPGWVEAQGPDDTSVLQELPDHRPETQDPHTGDRREGYWLRKASAQHRPVPVSNHSVVATESGHVPGKYRRCRGQVPQTPKRQSKRLQSTKKRRKQPRPSKK